MEVLKGSRDKLIAESGKYTYDRAVEAVANAIKCNTDKLEKDNKKLAREVETRQRILEKLDIEIAEGTDTTRIKSLQEQEKWTVRYDQAVRKLGENVPQVKKIGEILAFVKETGMTPAESNTWLTKLKDDIAAVRLENEYLQQSLDMGASGKGANRISDIEVTAAKSRAAAESAYWKEMDKLGDAPGLEGQRVAATELLAEKMLNAELTSQQKKLDIVIDFNKKYRDIIWWNVDEQIKAVEEEKKAYIEGGVIS